MVVHRVGQIHCRCLIIRRSVALLFAIDTDRRRISRGKIPTESHWVGLERTIVEGSESCPSLLVEPPGVCEKERSEAYSSWTHRCIAVFENIVTRRSDGLDVRE